ncbi:MAG: MFS transporter [Parvularculaceae bacterium]|nr:MFS transporter [Parvularculaceae bacterium]
MSDKTRADIPRTVWALGFVSFFMDVSSESIHALLPLFLTTTLGASVALVGFIDGVAESTAAISKVFSGRLSDRLGRRKPLILIGYGLGAASKPLFAAATAPAVVFAARFADRIGKGIRGAPRDALVADAAPEGVRGKAFGLRQALDTGGAVAGPVLAMALMAVFSNDMRAVFWVAAVPAAIAVLFVVFGVEEKARVVDSDAATDPPARLKHLPDLGRAFWMVTTIGAAFTLARFSEAFLVLKANREGLPLAFAPAALVAMNLFYMLGAYPAGALADRTPPTSLLAWGLAALVGADLLLAITTGVPGAFAGIALWGVHMALTQGLLAKMVADAAPASLRGYAFGVYNFATGLSLLAASVIAGVLWDWRGPTATFLAGAAFASAAAALVLAFRRFEGR